MVDIYEGSITLLIAAEVLQLLPRAIPGEAGHDDAVDALGHRRCIAGFCCATLYSFYRMKDGCIIQKSSARTSALYN